MSFASKEESVQDGAPIELFRFTTPEERFTYTSGTSPIEFENETFIPVPIGRGDDEIESVSESRQLAVTLPADDPFVLRYYVSLPSQQDRLEVFRLHTTDTPPEVVKIYDGLVSTVSAADDDTAKVNALSRSSLLERTVPTQTTRNLCNHVLYDVRCKVVDTSFALDAEVTGVSANQLRITIQASGTLPATGNGLSAQLTADPAYFNGGTIERAGFERRMIRSVSDIGGDAAEITIILPFAAIPAGAPFKIFAGCDHSFLTCRTKFDNEENYGGFPYVPRKNVFNTGADV